MKWLSIFLTVLLTFSTVCPMTLNLSQEHEHVHHASDNMDEPQCESTRCFVHDDEEEPLLAMGTEVFIPMPLFDFVLNDSVPYQSEVLINAPPLTQIPSTKTIVLRI